MEVTSGLVEDTASPAITGALLRYLRHFSNDGFVACSGRVIGKLGHPERSGCAFVEASLVRAGMKCYKKVVLPNMGKADAPGTVETR
jgi:hypothetical protein